ncbi:MAG: OmpH family outer membrane protein [Phascolarctobacterium sp.]|nr:OmpH family outer membrane protein [Phascolarctobacterium sp.]
MKKIFLTLVMTLVLALGCMSSAFAAESNLVGYVNVERVFRSYPDIKATMSVIDLERQKAQTEFNEKAPNLDDNGKRDLGQKLAERVDKKEASLLNPIRAAIRKAIGEVAKAHGIESVVDAGAMVFGGYDLTEEVIAKVATGK